MPASTARQPEFDPADGAAGTNRTAGTTTPDTAPTSSSPTALDTAPDDRTGAHVRGLTVALTASGIDVVDEIDLVLDPGEIVGLVGESGSGKTTVGTALLAYSRAGAHITGGSVDLDGDDILALGPDEVRRLRGRRVAYVPQDPGAALNPAIRIGRQIVELLELAREGDASERWQRARAGLEEVGLPSDDEFLARYPHQLSGGQVQRVALAMAMLPRPQVLVLDEPTTGLDVTTQNMVLKTVKKLCADHRVAALYVTHDLAVVANLADRVAVMYAGRIVELGPRDDIFHRPSHPYTRALLDAIPHLSSARALAGIPGSTPGPGRRPQACRFHDRCAHATSECATIDPPAEEVSAGHIVRCLRRDTLPAWSIDTGDIADTDPATSRDVVLSVEHLDVFYGRKQVVFDVNFDLARGEVLAFVGESGSGKTTTARAIGGLSTEWTGRVALDGHDLARGARRRQAEERKRIQYIFQNPYLSLNPRLTIEQIVTRPMELFGLARGKDARDRAVELLDAVALGPTVLGYRTNRLSGGERQRVAIARALAAEPDILVCDEITSALDVSVQGSIVALLDRLKRERGISMLFVTHNLALVRSIADRVQVLQHGRVVEQGFVVRVMEDPQENYTRALLANTPTLR